MHFSAFCVGVLSACSVAVPAGASVLSPVHPLQMDKVGRLAFLKGECADFCKGNVGHWRCHPRYPWPVKCEGQSRNAKPNWYDPSALSTQGNDAVGLAKEQKKERKKKEKKKEEEQGEEEEQGDENGEAGHASPSDFGDSFLSASAFHPQAAARL